MMKLLDFRTILLSYALSNAVCTIVIGFLWQQNRKHSKALDFWFADFIFQFIAVLLVALRGMIPDTLSVALGSPLILSGTLLLYIGLGRYLGRERPQTANLILLCALVAAHLYFTAVQPSILARTLVLSIGVAILCGQCAWLTLRGLPPGMRGGARVAGVTFALFCLLSIARIATIGDAPRAADALQTSAYDAGFVLVYQVLFIALTFGLFLLVNQRLFLSLDADIAERKRVQQALQASEDMLRGALDSAPIGMALVSEEGRFTRVNPALCGIVGFAQEELLGLPLAAVTHPDDLARDAEQAGRMQAGALGSYEIEKRYRRKDGQTVWVQETSSLLQHGDGAPRQIVKQVQDITERKSWEHLLQQQARTDFLTGFANRRYFIELAEHEAARARRYGSPFSIAMMDIDHFKAVIDRYGHEAGDHVLRKLAEICSNTLRKLDVVGRIGGEEFAILLPQTDGGAAGEVAERLRAEIGLLDAAFGAEPLRVTVSIGIAQLSALDADIDALMRRADRALYQAKSGGRNRTCRAAAAYPE